MTLQSLLSFLSDRFRLAGVVAVTVALLIGIPAPASAGPIDNVYVFGDSLLDVGNLFAATAGATPPSPPYDNGRFSNGPLAVELFAGSFGVTLQPSLLGGTDYAWANAFAQSTPVSGVPNLIDQVDAFVAALGGGSADPNAIYVLDGGGNDIGYAVMTGDPTLVSTALAAVEQSIQELAGAGATRLLVYDAPDIGATPDFAGGPGAGAATALSALFNAGLANFVAAERAGGVDVRLVDVFGLEHEIFNDPAAFGFSNVSQSCLVGDVVCADPDAYFYWDGFHPTAHAGQLLAAAMVAAAPEPGTLTLLLIAVAAVVEARRRHARRRTRLALPRS